jgi:nickel transport protein
MKSLIQRGVAALTFGGLMVGSLIATGLNALALTSEEITQQLLHVPVFTVTDEAGSPLVSEISDQDDVPPVTQVFISQTDAQAFIDNLSTDNPDLAASVQVTPVSLARIYEVAVMGQEEQSRLEFIFVPQATQVESAVDIIQSSGELEEPINEFAGVPLFTARSAQGEGNENVGYLTIQQGESEVIPMFFTEEDLQSLLTEIETNQPDLANTLEPHVLRLEDLIYTFETSDNAELQQIRLIPSSETLRYLQEQAPQSEAQ